jgi:hypothetical protein
MFAKAVLMSLLAVAAYAQRGGRGDGMDNGGIPRPNVGIRIAQQSQLDAISNRLKLTDGQKVEVEDILNAAQKEATPVRETLVKTRQAMTEASVIGNAEKIAQATAAYAEVLGRMTAIEAGAFAKICATLEAKQRSRAEQAFELMDGIFLSADWRRM